MREAVFLLKQCILLKGSSGTDVPLIKALLSQPLDEELEFQSQDSEKEPEPQPVGTSAASSSDEQPARKDSIKSVTFAF